MAFARPPPLADTLGSRSLPWLFLVILLGMTATYLALAEAGKALFYRHEQARQLLVRRAS